MKFTCTQRTVSVDVDLEAANPAGSQIIDGRADGCEDSANQTINQGKENDRPEAHPKTKQPRTRRSRLAHSAQRPCDHGNERHADPQHKSYQCVENKAHLESRTWPNPPYDSHTASSRKSSRMLAERQADTQPGVVKP